MAKKIYIVSYKTKEFGAGTYIGTYNEVQAFKAKIEQLGAFDITIF